MIEFIVSLSIFIGLCLFAKNRSMKKLERLAEDELNEYKKQGLTYIGQYAGDLLDGLDDVGSCSFTIILFKEKIELTLGDGRGFRKEINIRIDDIKSTKIITERHLIEEDNTKENKKNFLKYGLVGEKLLENEKEVKLTGINLVKLNIIYKDEDVSLLFKFITDEREFVQYINNLINKNNKSDLAN